MGGRGGLKFEGGVFHGVGEFPGEEFSVGGAGSGAKGLGLDEDGLDFWIALGDDVFEPFKVFDVVEASVAASYVEVEKRAAVDEKLFQRLAVLGL